MVMRGKIKTPVLTPKEVCDYLHLSRATLQRYMKAGEISYIKMGWAVRFYEADIVKFLDSKRLSVTHSPALVYAT